MSLRVLIVDSDPEETLFLQDVLAEIQEGRHWAAWLEIDCLHAPTWSDAHSLLTSESGSSSATGSIDVILLSLNLEDAQGADAFYGAHTLVPHIPVVLLTPESDTELAIRLVREGAQDFAMVSRVECASLAHTMRNAIERHRALAGLRSALLLDTLTGLPDRAGFTLFAERDRKLAERLRCRLMLILGEPRNIAEISAVRGAQRRDLIIMEAADHLRSLAGPAALLGRVSETRFGLTVFDTPVESVEAAWSRIHLGASDRRIDIGAAIFDLEHPVGLDTLFDHAARDLAPESAPSAALAAVAPNASSSRKSEGMRT